MLPSGDYGTLYLTATWPDRDARSNPRYAWVDPLHYIYVDIGAARVEVNDANCERGDCVISAIERFSRQLRDPEAPEWKRINALRLVAHFVGDMHQPLINRRLKQAGVRLAGLLNLVFSRAELPFD